MSDTQHKTAKERSVSVLEKLKKLEAEAKDLRGQAKKEAMQAVKAALADLNALGFDYSLVEGNQPAAPKKRGPKPGKSGITRKRDPNKPCPVCGEKGHDARRHRWDKDKKKK